MWQLTATDGRFAGTLDFLASFALRFAPNYSVLRAEVTITPNDNPFFEDYNFHTDSGKATLTFRRALRQGIQDALGMEPSSPLEGAVVAAFYRDNRVKGFSSLHEGSMYLQKPLH